MFWKAIFRKKTPGDSLLNHEQESRATTAPTQPTSDHTVARLMHTAGAQFRNHQAPTPLVPAKDEALQKAIQEYISKLSNDDKAAFQSAPDIIERLDEMQHKSKTPIPSSLATRAERVLQCIKYFMGSLSIFIQQSPEISSLVVGGVSCILSVGST